MNHDSANREPRLPPAVVKRLFWRMRTYGVSLSNKILGLLLGAVVLSTSLAGWIIYDGLRARAWKDAGAALLQDATSSAVGVEIDGLDSVRGPSDRFDPAYRGLTRVLRELGRRDASVGGSSGRLSVLRFTPSVPAAVQVAGLNGGSFDVIGLPQPLDNALYRAVATQEAQLKDYLVPSPWLTAYAPLGRSGDAYYLLKLSSDTLPLRRELWGQLETIVLGIVAGLVLTLLGGWVLTAQITRPLRAFVDVMKLMQSTDDYGMKIDLHPEDRDMSVLESTFQSLAGRMQESREREEQSYWATLQALVTALDVRDNETAGHSVRVTRYSLAIGERLRLSSEAMEQLRQGALLHDIGKIGVPDAILRKNGRLTSEEWVEMRKHPDIGNTFLSDIDFLKPSMAVVYCHHERWDGKGYPRGLAGEAIPRAARVFAVADALDAITSRRYYKEARAFREAQEEIIRCAGSHFDPDVVKAFRTIPEKVFQRIRLETNRSGIRLERLRKGSA